MIKSLNITGTKRLYDFYFDTTKKYENLYNAIQGKWYKGFFFIFDYNDL